MASQSINVFIAPIAEHLEHVITKNYLASDLRNYYIHTKADSPRKTRVNEGWVSSSSKVEGQRLTKGALHKGLTSNTKTNQKTFVD